jgi:hypothetical protein
MARTPNYGQQRADRNRVKQAKKEAKLRDLEEAAARRKAERGAEEQSADEPMAATKAPNGKPTRP